jgi:hypothetical protein
MVTFTLPGRSPVLYYNNIRENILLCVFVNYILCLYGYILILKTFLLTDGWSIFQYFGSYGSVVFRAIVWILTECKSCFCGTSNANTLSSSFLLDLVFVTLTFYTKIMIARRNNFTVTYATEWQDQELKLYIIWLKIFRFWAYMMKVIPETRRMH